MNHAIAASSPRLKRLVDILRRAKKAGQPLSTRQIVMCAEVLAVRSAIAELRD